MLYVPFRGMRLLNSGTVAAAATLDVSLAAWKGSKEWFLLKIKKIMPATDNVSLWARMASDAAGTVFDATGYHHAAWQLEEALTPAHAYSGATAAAAQIVVSANTLGNVAHEASDWEIVIPNNFDDTVHPRIRWSGSFLSPLSLVSSAGGAARRSVIQDITGIRLLFSAGNIAVASWELHG